MPSSLRSGAARSYLLLVEAGSSSIVSLPANGSVLVGRGAEADVRLQEEGASRRHARFSIVHGEVHVADLDSHNGTRVNGAPIRGARALGSGDVIGIGEATLVLHTEAHAAARVALDEPALRARLVGEVDRALGCERAFSVIVLAGDALTSARADAVARVGERLRPYHVVGWLGDRALAVAAPELDGDAAVALAERLVEALDGRAAAGVADCPADGCDGDALLQASRAAAEAAGAGAVERAVDGTHRMTLGDRVVIVADPAMVRLYELVRRLAATTLSVLVTGETGAGKENAAFAVHYHSSRRDKPFVGVNCAAIQDTLVESELFGHEKGAFSGAATAKPGLFELADSGTVFLDEVGELSPSVQAKLLRAIETQRIQRVGALRDRAIDVRLVAATHRDLEADVKTGRFRQDLLYRLGAATVALPPLRDRPREVALLARAFLDAACSASGRAPAHLSAASLHRLARYAWPGNVRELKNAMGVLAATVTDETIEPWHLPDRIRGEAVVEAPPPENAPAAPSASPSATPTATFVPLAEEIRDLERRRMAEARVVTRGNRTRAADLLGVPLRTFLVRIKQYDLTEHGRER